MATRKDGAMPEVTDVGDEFTRVARDAAYIAVGVGVLAFQRLQVRRQDLKKRLADSQIEDRIVDVRDELAKRVRDVDEAVEQLIARVEASLEPIEDRLPFAARDLVRQAHTQAREARVQIRKLLTTAA